MPSLKDLRNRITSVKSTQKITKAMKMVAAAKLRKAQENAEKGRAYSEKMNNIISNLKKSITDISSSPKLLSGNNKSEVHLCVVMTADRGLCGGFNTNIVKEAREARASIMNDPNLSEDEKDRRMEDLEKSFRKELEAVGADPNRYRI